MQDKRVAVLVANAHREPFLSIDRANIRKGREILENFLFDVFYYEGRQIGRIEGKFRDNIESIRYKKFWHVLKVYDSIVLNNRWRTIETAKLIPEQGKPNRLIAPSPEDLRHLAVKFYASLQYCIVENYDFVLRTTTNSLFNLRNIINHIEHSDTSKPLYMGRKLELSPRSPMVSGSFLLLNRASMQVLRDNIPNHDHSVLDDVAIGKILGYEAQKLEPSFANSIDFNSIEEVDSLRSEDFVWYTHYRCKTKVNPRNDNLVLKKLVSRLIEAGIRYI